MIALLKRQQAWKCRAKSIIWILFEQQSGMNTAKIQTCLSNGYFNHTVPRGPSHRFLGYSLTQARVDTQLGLSSSVNNEDPAATPLTVVSALPRYSAALTGTESPSTSSSTSTEDASYIPSYSWVDYWLQVEDRRQFRQQVFAATRGRRAQRHQWMLDNLVGEGTESDAEDELLLTDQVIDGRLCPSATEITSSSDNNNNNNQGQGSINGFASSQQQEEGDIVDDLAWLASHPELLDPEIGESNPGPRSAASTNTPNPHTEWSKLENAKLLHPVELNIGGAKVQVRPLWIAVFQLPGSATARLFESVVPLQDQVLERMSLDVAPFCSIAGLDFGAFADVQDGSWHNFYIGLIGDVGVEEHEILWPNQLLHRDRVLYNVRSAEDIAKFLADPKPDDVKLHQENLERLAEERKYRKGWCWHMLRARWGQQTLDQMNIVL